MSRDELDDVQGAALVRLHRATMSEHWVLIPGGDPVRGSGVDRSERISIDWIYRTLGVDSRVAFTRLLLRAPIAGRRR